MLQLSFGMLYVYVHVYMYFIYMYALYMYVHVAACKHEQFLSVVEWYIYMYM